MGRRFMYCPTCRRLSWARTDRKTGRCFCTKCGNEIPTMENISLEPDNFSIMKDHISYPEISKTGGLE